MEPTHATVDVRDMLCAQALAVVAQAQRQLRRAETLRILYNAEDVKRDLLAWAAQQGHEVREAGPSAMDIARRA